MVRSHEVRVVAGKRLGRRPHDPNRRALRLGRMLTGVIPQRPASADHFSKITNWGMLDNDQYGDCGPASVFHDRMLIRQYLAGTPLLPDTAATLDLYKRSGNPSFPSEDNGVVIADMLAEVAKPVSQGGGIGGVNAIAYAKIDITDLDERDAALAIFGSLILGVGLTDAQEAQTDAGKPWDVVSGSPDWGGHAVLAGAYTGDTASGRPDVSVITWGATQGITDAFWAQQVQEAWVVIWPEHLGTAEFLAGIDRNVLVSDYADLFGVTLVIPPNPTPVVPPAPAAALTAAELAANQALAALAVKYIQGPHIGGNSAMAAGLRTWMTAWGYPVG